MSFPAARQLAIQFAALFAVLCLAWPYFGVTGELLPWRETSLAIGGVALLLATASRQPSWWCVIHAGFAPLVWLTLQAEIDPSWFLAAFVILMLVYRGALAGQVPLYLSNAPTIEAVGDILAARPPGRFVDLGAGVGTTLIPLASQFPDWQFIGVENAPLTWLTGALRGGGLNNLSWRWGDLWKTSTADADVIYAFLSPAPMPSLWEKLQAEMPAGSLFISNSFPVPDVEPDEVIEVACTPARSLYLYRLG